MAKKKSAKITKGDIPTLVKILAVLNYVGAGFCILVGLLFLFAGSLLSSLLISYLGDNIVSGLTGTGLSVLFVFFGIFLLGFSVLNIFVGRGLWTGKNWARILTIIFSCLSIFGSFSSIIKGKVFSGIFDIAISGLIAWYLLFNEEVKKAFEK